jgi:hypothetical protein
MKHGINEALQELLAEQIRGNMEAVIEEEI